MTNPVVYLYSSIDKIQIDGDLLDDTLIMQFQSDVMNSQIKIALFKNISALGATMAAGYTPEINV